MKRRQYKKSGLDVARKSDDEKIKDEWDELNYAHRKITLLVDRF